MINLEMKRAKECDPGTLIRMDFGDGVQWAIVAAPANGMRLVLLLDGQGAPWFLDILGSDLCETGCLSYGNDFLVEPDHFGECAVDKDNLIIQRGVLLYARDNSNGAITNRYLAGGVRPAGTQRLYLNLETFETRGEPAGLRAAFGHWDVFADGRKQSEPLKLLSRAVSSQTTSAPQNI